MKAKSCRGKKNRILSFLLKPTAPDAMENYGVYRNPTAKSYSLTTSMGVPGAGLEMERKSWREKNEARTREG